LITSTITNKNRPKATVVMLISLYGKQYKKSIGVGVLVKYWNAVKKRAKVTADFNGNPVNDEIDRWEEIDEDIHLSSFYDMEETDAPPPHKLALSSHQPRAVGPCVVYPVLSLRRTIPI